MATENSVDLITLVQNNTKPDANAAPADIPVGLREFNQKELENVLDCFSVQAIQSMGVGRALPNDKKSRLIASLIRKFYDANNIKAALSKLSPNAQYGLARLKINGGIMDRNSWLAQVSSRFGKNAGELVEKELVGRALALYAMHEGPFLQLLSRSKHEIGRPGFYAGATVICVPSKVLEFFMAGKSILDIVAPPPPQPYDEKASKVTPKLVAPANFEALLADIFTFTRYLEQNKVRVLQSGDIGKRDYVKIHEQMQVKEATDPADSRKLSETGRVSFLWNVLLTLKMVGGKPNENAFVNSEVSQRFYALPRYLQGRVLAVAWTLSQYSDFTRIPTLEFETASTETSDIPEFEKLSNARTLIMSIVQAFFDKGQLNGNPDSGWLDLTSLMAIVKEVNLEILVSRGIRPGSYYGYGNGYYGETYYNGFTSILREDDKKKGATYVPGKAIALDTGWNLVEGEWLVHLFREPLNWLGLAELGLDPITQRGIAFRLIDFGRSVLAGKPSAQEEETAKQTALLAAQAPELTRSLIVQPNFDIMVLAPLQNMTLLQQIDRFANPSSMGDVAMYRISKESVMRGMRAGLSGPDILDILQNNSRVPVSQNIIASLNDWNNEYERIVVRPSVHLLEVPDATILDKLMADPKAAANIEKRLGPTFALIKGKADSLDKALMALMNKAQPLYLDYTKVYPNTISVQNSRRLVIKEYLGNAYLYYRLGQFADLVEHRPNKQTATFELSAAAGKRGQSLGLTYDLVQAFLTQWGNPRQSLPPETTLILKNWLGYYSPLKGEKAVTLTTALRSQLDEIFSLPEFAPLLIERASPKVALVRQDLLEQLLPRLQEMGVEFDLSGLNPEAASPQPDTTTEAKPETSGRKSSKGETLAERERRQREASAASGFGPFGGGPLATGRGFISPPTAPATTPSEDDLYGLMKLMREAMILEDFDGDEDDDSFEPPPFFPRGRGRRR